jgi:DNA-binding MarR family transcriptional regulator
MSGTRQSEWRSAEVAPGEPRWLSSRERAAWVALTGMVIKLPSVLDGQLHRDAGLTYFEYMVLAMLSEEPCRRLRMTQLSVLTGGSLSRLSHVAKRLERDGLILRQPDPIDRRSTNAVLTEAGWRTVVAAAPGHVATVRKMVLDALTAEQIDQLAEIGDAVLRRIDPEGQTRPPGAPA